jgi:hypothetical protein|tara:strand:- start:687 stop:1247 length:561 start_codon:yes stop_codon:yes gene_type:complete
MKEPTKINFEEDRMESVSQIDASKSLSNKVIELKTMEDEIQNAENSLSKLKEKAKVLSQIEIPQMMDEMQITKLKLRDGESVEIKKIYGASIPHESQQEAFQWLREHDLGDIIKNDITVTFGRGEDNKAMQYANLAKGQGFEPIQKIGVHPQTLKAVVRERLESGREMPTGLFKTFAGNQTKITRR